MFKQIISPNPNIACRPGWCLEYVRKTFGLGIVNPTATAAWNASPTKHRDRNFPAAWVPVWFSVAGVPAGHVALRAPDGSVFSTTNPASTVPRKHPNLDDLMGVYARAGLPLTYLGWSEDVQGTPVVVWAPDPAPVKLLTVTAAVATVRTTPRVEPGNVARAYPAGISRGAKVAAVGYVKGVDPFPRDGKLDDAWIKTVSGYYIWANVLGNSLAGLPRLN